MFIIIWPVCEMMITVYTRIWTFAGVNTSMCLFTCHTSGQQKNVNKKKRKEKKNSNKHKIKSIQFFLFRTATVVVNLLTVRTPLKRKRLPQNSQWYGISPVCVRICSLSVFFSRKSLQQILHLWGR